jgi:hypothetical protein
MSMLVRNGKDPVVYVICDEHVMVLVDAFSTIGEAVRRRDALQLDGRKHLALHNLTHSTCPEWVKNLVNADPEYCDARAQHIQERADGMRRAAAEKMAEAARLEAMAQEWLDRKAVALTNDEPKV